MSGLEGRRRGGEVEGEAAMDLYLRSIASVVGGRQSGRTLSEALYLGGNLPFLMQVHRKVFYTENLVWKDLARD